MASSIFVSRGSSYVPSTLSLPFISIVLVIGLILFFQRDFIFTSICSIAISGTFWQERKWTDVKVHWKAQNDHDVNCFIIFEYIQYITITLWKKRGHMLFSSILQRRKERNWEFKLLGQLQPEVCGPTWVKPTFLNFQSRSLLTR